MKRIISLLLVIVCVLSLVGCSERSDVYKHLVKDESYAEYKVTLDSIVYIDNEYKSQTDFKSEGIKNARGVVLKVVFADVESYSRFFGAQPEKELSEYVISLGVTIENNLLLCESKFYTDVSEKKELTVRASSLIYEQSSFFFISFVSYGGKEYLAHEKGIANIIEMMDANPNLF